MAGRFDDLLRCSLGDGIDFQLEDYSRKESPRFDPAGTNIGNDVTISGKGWIEATNVASLQTKLGEFVDAARISGVDFTIEDLEEEMVSIEAAACLERGPHVSFTIGEQLAESPLWKPITFELHAKTIGTFLASPPVTHPWQEHETIQPDGTRVVRRSGEINKTGARAYFDSNVWAQFQSTFPNTAWVVTARELQTTIDNNWIKYSITAKKVHASLPALDALVVDGEATIRVSEDGTGRRIRTYGYDLLITPPMTNAATVIAAINPGGQILREDYEVTTFQRVNLRATFEVLESTSEDDLLHFKQVLKYTKSGNVFDVKKFNTLDPLLVRKDKHSRILTQSGEASGLAKFPVEPAALYPDALIGEPDVTFERLHASGEFQTSWTYVMAIDDEETFDPADTVRPASPTFYGA